MKFDSREEMFNRVFKCFENGYIPNNLKTQYQKNFDKRDIFWIYFRQDSQGRQIFNWLAAPKTTKEKMFNDIFWRMGNLVCEPFGMLLIDAKENRLWVFQPEDQKVFNQHIQIEFHSDFNETLRHEWNNGVLESCKRIMIDKAENFDLVKWERDLKRDKMIKNIKKVTWPGRLVGVKLNE